MTPALDIFRRTFAATDSVASAIEAVYAAGYVSIRAATRIARKIERGEFKTLSQVTAACRAARR